MPQESTAKILNCLLLAKNALTPKEISERTGVSHLYVKKRLRELEADGKVVRLERGRYLISDLGVTFVKPVEESPIELLIKKINEINQKLDLILQGKVDLTINKESLKQEVRETMPEIRREVAKPVERPKIQKPKMKLPAGIPDFVADNPWGEIISEKGRR